MFDFFKKKGNGTAVEKLEAQHQVVIFNLLDHESIIAANLYKASTVFCNVTLIDIRDPVLPAESYLWLGVGDRDSLQNYYRKTLNPEQLQTVLDNSVFIERPDLLTKLSALVVERNGGGVEKTPLLAKWNISAKAFYQNNGEVGRLVRYYQVLDMCHDAHVTSGDASEDIVAMSVEAGDAEISAFYAKQQRINKGLANKIRHMTYPISGGSTVSFIQFATMDKVAYSIIRRAMSTGKNFLHQSMGVYGQVIYSNRKFDRSLFDHSNDGVLFIQGD